MNNVAKFRVKANLSQRALAALVGVSQQTIQRIEAEATTVRFETAVSLAAALKLPLRRVFPEMRKKLDPLIPQLPNERIDYSHSSHTIKMAFLGGPIRYYLVDHATSIRVRNAIMSGRDFVVFDTLTHAVAVNVNKLIWTNFLFDPGDVFEPGENEDSFTTINMYFDGEPGAESFDVDPDTHEPSEDNDYAGSELQMLLMDLDMRADSGDTDPLSFLDGDGEELVFHPARLKAIEIPLPAVNPQLLSAIFDGMDEEEEEPLPTLEDPAPT